MGPMEGSPRPPDVAEQCGALLTLQFRRDDSCGTSAGIGRNELELDQIDLLAAAMFGDLEQVDHTEEAGAAGEVAGHVRQGDLTDGFDEDMALLHRVEAACLHVRALPDADRAGDAAVADSLAQAFGELHRR